MVQQFLRSIFANDRLYETREPILTIPFGESGNIEVLPPDLGMWSDILVLMFIQISFTTIFAIFVYQFIIPNRGKTISYLLGYGVVIPIVLQLPYPIIDYLAIRSHVLRTSLAILPSNVTFRCIEAMHGTSLSKAVEHSQLNYIIYYSAVVDYVWDEKTMGRVAVTVKEFVQKVFRTVQHMITVSFFLSLLLEYNFKVFPSNVVLSDYHLTWELLYPGQLANNYLYAVTLYLILATGFSVGSMMNNLMGYVTGETFRNPLWSSTSPSDFWGRRWNLVIHTTLKRAAFKPVVEAGYPRWAGVTMAFIASGLLHDYTWSILFYKSEHDYNPTTGQLEAVSSFTPLLFKQSVFFLWCGLTMVIERHVAQWKIIQWMERTLPLVVRSTLIVLTALPFAHFYAGDWITGNYFNEFSHGVMRFRYVPNDD